MPSPADFILTKVLATLGPACQESGVLWRMIEEGVRVVRINFSHGTFEDFAASLAVVRQASAQTQIPIGVLGDLCGPKIRLERVENARIDLHVGDQVEFTRRDIVGRRHDDTGVTVLSTTYPAMVDEAEPGQRLYIDDGNVRLLIVDKVRVGEEEGTTDDLRLHCRVTQGGPISDKKGVNLPDTTILAPSLTEWDHQCTRWAVANGLDFLALSFVRKADDVQALRDLIEQRQATGEARSDHASGHRGARLPIIAKLEKPQAIEDLEAICDAADGVMVARGDLGVEMELARVPVLQKRITKVAHDYGKPVIVATQMLQSMIEHATPTRAEVSDVANAIIDGADAVMLSGETAVGAYPTRAVRAMAQAALYAEAYTAETHRGTMRPPQRLQESRYRTAALAHGVGVVVHDLRAKYVVTWSELGGGAGHLSQNRLPVPIVAVSSSEAALRRMSLMFGVTPVLMARPADTETFIHRIDTLLLDHQWAQAGDTVVIARGVPLGTPGVTNQIHIHYLGDVCRVQGEKEGVNGREGI